ncbi:hypothetical protein SeMB42_g01660 [Synchytrium endobioticum]|uniref:Cohesin loading factor n=1 Tax=Synchytrium endobioticum TaxID=286115 RepID=A0A507DK95_9FUNG|nr:hypothetical protein SeMB42_g01660 [Synchytrium endobioticum]
MILASAPRWAARLYWLNAPSRDSTPVASLVDMLEDVDADADAPLHSPTIAEIALQYPSYMIWFAKFQHIANNDIAEAIKSKDAALVQQHVNMAIACLEYEIMARYHLASVLITYTDLLELADTHLQKGLVMLSQSGNMIQDSVDLMYCFKNLQIAIFERRNVLKAAKKMLKDMSNDASTLQRMDLWYLSQIKGAQVAISTNDIKQSRTILSSGAAEAAKRGDVDMQAIFEIILLRYDFMMVSSHKPNTIKESLSRLRQLLYPSNANLQQELIPSLLKPEVWYTGCIMDVLCELQCGQPSSAMAKISNILKKVDETNVLMQAVPDTGFVTIHVRTTNTGNDTIPLKFQILPRYCMNIFLCLVAGVCRKCSECDKSHRYLIEGLKIIDRVTNIPDDTDIQVGLWCQEWMREIKIHFLRYAAECCIVQGTYGQAAKHLTALTQHLSCRPTQTTSQQAVLNVCWGMLHTAIGDVAKASVYLVAAMQLAKEDVELEHAVGVLAKASLVLLWSDKNVAKEKQLIASDFRQELTARATTAEASPYEKLISSLVQSIYYTDPERMGLQKAKVFLLEIIQQTDAMSMHALNAMALCFLGNLFTSTEPEQAEKIMSKSLKVFSKKVKGVNATTSVIASTLSDLHAARGDRDLAEKHKALAAQHKEASDNAVQEARKVLPVDLSA